MRRVIAIAIAALLAAVGSAQSASYRTVTGTVEYWIDSERIECTGPGIMGNLPVSGEFVEVAVTTAEFAVPVYSNEVIEPIPLPVYGDGEAADLEHVHFTAHFDGHGMVGTPLIVESMGAEYSGGDTIRIWSDVTYLPDMRLKVVAIAMRPAPAVPVERTSVSKLKGEYRE